MSLSTRLRRFARAGAGHVATVVGEAVLVHARDGGTAEARALAASLPADPGHLVVVVDLPSESPVEVWESFAAALPQGRGPVRLVPGRHPRRLGPRAGQWLAERLGRAVLAPYGLTHQGAAGSLFVHSGEHTGWGWYRPGREPEWAAKRFPRPVWDSPAVAEVRPSGAGAVAEPLPAGMWIRPDGADDLFARGRVRLIRSLPCHPEALTIVLGSQDVPGLELTEIAVFWRTLPPDVRAKAWFVELGGVVVPEGTTLGQALADLLGEEVRCYTGFPVGSPEAPDVFTLRSDGSHGWNTFARGFAYRPRGVQPRLCAGQSPIADLRQVAPGVYQYSPDVVIEIVEAGLWVRSPEEIAAEATARTLPLDPVHNLVLYEAADPANAERMRGIAASVVDRLDYPTRLVTTLMPAAVPSGAEPVEPVGPVGPVEPVEMAEDEATETGSPWLSGRKDTMSLQPPVSGPAGPPVSRLVARLDGISDGGHRIAEPVLARPVAAGEWPRMASDRRGPSPSIEALPGTWRASTDRVHGGS
ncbi:hypothetical protein [Amycolatopsis sp. H20-H5]|uniref:hypothetical protein n=1 Tax=Amycolatopsis sp. H20-H5 TaxID=3046309 RepID=UPI002DBE3439|nr:hypothetical protein [Amycolatopsis sp. H20-H5]MEC3980820.1 hypothetical protein [Amycolatopsis sp. H20-H5]